MHGSPERERANILRVVDLNQSWGIDFPSAARHRYLIPLPGGIIARVWQMHLSQQAIRRVALRRCRLEEVPVFTLECAAVSKRCGGNRVRMTYAVRARIGSQTLTGKADACGIEISTLCQIGNQPQNYAAEDGIDPAPI